MQQDVALCISSSNTGNKRFGILVNRASLQGSLKGGAACEISVSL